MLVIWDGTPLVCCGSMRDKGHWSRDDVLKDRRVGGEVISNISVAYYFPPVASYLTEPCPWLLATIVRTSAVE